MKEPIAAASLLEALDDEQRAVALAPRGPVCVKAGAGTGKTRAITYRMAYGIATGIFEPRHILAVTFTTRAAHEMTTRMRALEAGKVRARTFHSAALSQLSYFWRAAVGGPRPQLLPHKASLVASVASRLGIEVNKTAVRDLAAEIEWAAVSLLDSHNYVDECAARGHLPPNGVDPERMAALLASYAAAKREANVIDHEDVLTLTCGMLEERLDIAERVRDQYRHFLIDEYQDVSPLQSRLLDLWLGKRDDVCVVGDAAQTIYSFAGASASYLKDFPARFPHATLVELVRDYRSTPQVVALANALVAGDKSSGAVRLKAQRPGGPAVRFCTWSDDEDEAAGIVTQIRELHARGVKLSDIAILFRINAQSQVYESALADAGITYVVHGGARFFDRREIRQAVTVLRAASVVTADGDIVEATQAAIEAQGWTPEAPTGEGARREKWDNLGALLDLARTHQASNHSLKEFVAELDARIEAQHAPVIDGVTLSTIHAAKGLEWPAVFLAGCEDTMLPFRQADTPAAVAEERRLAYVAVTRAGEHLTISYARARHSGGRRTRKPSRFFRRVWPPEPSSATSARQVKKTKRHTFEDPDDAALYDTLKAWRKQVATQVGKPAYIIATDALLEDVAVARPRTLVQLGALRGIGPAKLERLGAPLLALVRGEDPTTQALRAAAAWSQDADLAAPTD